MKYKLTILFVAFISSILFAQNEVFKIDSIVKSYHDTNPKVRISVGFIKNNQEYYTSYGKLSNESDIEVNKNSVFEIASITKIITANLIAQAEIEGKLKLDDYIDNYLPKDFSLNKNIKQKVRISDLASHQSGLPDLDFRALIEVNSQQPVSSVTKESLTTMINNCSTLIDYGTYRYSTVGYTLLGQILENIYSKSYDEILREKIITPLQMTNTLTKDFDVSNITSGYNPNGGEQELFNWNITASAGLVKSNASDMITYLKAILNQETEIGKASLITEKIFYKDDNRAMGLGFGIVKDDPNTICLKSGDSMGQSSIICFNREKQWGVIILVAQRNSRLVQGLLNDIYETILK